MKKSFLWATILLSGTFSLVGCGGGDDNDDSSSAAAPAAVPAAPAAVPAADPSEAANAAFAATTPSGLQQSDKFTIAGRGTALAVACHVISGAKSYTFTTSFGASEISALPRTAFMVTVAQAGAPYTLSVYATNENGINTKTGSATVN